MVAPNYAAQRSARPDSQSIRAFKRHDGLGRETVASGIFTRELKERIKTLRVSISYARSECGYLEIEYLTCFLENPVGKALFLWISIRFSYRYAVRVLTNC
jgi:hypothetical protein